MKLGELYGETDPNTFEWTDGLIASATRKFAKDFINIEEQKAQSSKAESDDVNSLS